MLSKYQIADLLDEIADMLDFTGENVFKVNAYKNGASSIRKCEADIIPIISGKKLNEIKGIGKGLQSVIYEFVETGNSSLIEELKSKVPQGLSQLLKIRGLGAKKILLLFNNLDIKNIEELENACIEKKLTTIKGFGEKIQEKILEEIEKIKENKKFLLLSIALKYAEEISSKLKYLGLNIKYEYTGELRRKCEIISSIEFIVQISQELDKEKIAADFELSVDQNIGQNTSIYAVPLIFHFISPDEYIEKLFVTTGSNDFVKKIADNKTISGFNSEEELFNSFNVNYVIPEMRESEFFDHNQNFTQNSNLEFEGYNGLLHFHTTYSDGTNSIEEMAKAAIGMGLEYAIVCDHSKTAAYANGLQEDRLAIQGREIKQLAKKLNFPLFQGIESDILGDGSLDFPEEALRELKFVVASVHSRFNLDEKEQTARIIKAVENPFTRLLGHPSGRLLLSREPYKIDIKKIIDACADNKTAIEINASPNRLDLDWRWIYYAREKGCLFAINADAHSIADLSKTMYGIAVARKAGLLKSEVINYYALAEFEKFLTIKG